MSATKSGMQYRIVLPAFAAAYGVGLLTLIMLPFLISAIMQGLGLSEEQAGYLMSAEFIFTMVSSLAISPFINRVPRRMVALIGAIVAIGANIASAYIFDLYLLVAVRSIAGLGAGLALASGNSLIASADNPDKVAGQVNVLFVVMMIISMLLFGSIADNFGLKGIYFGIAATYVIMFILISFMPKEAELAARVKASNDQSDLPQRSSVRLTSMVAIAMMATMFLFSMRDTMGWAFVGEVGNSLGYTDTQMGIILGIQAFIALIGPFIVAVVGKRFGMTIPVLIGIILHGSITLGYLMGSASKILYTGVVLLNATAYFYALAYLTGLAASLDKEGRIVAATGSFLALGVAAGPVFAGKLITIGGYTLVGWSIIGVVTLTVITVILPLRRFNEEQKVMDDAQEDLAAAV